MYELGYLLIVVFCAFLLYAQVRTNPASFSAANITKSMLLLGFLALVLLLFLTFVIVLLRADS